MIIGKTGDTFESNPNLAEELQTQHVKRLVIFGVQSECCVLSTCKGANAAGFEVVLLSGAHGTYDGKVRKTVEIEKDVESEVKGLVGKVVHWEDFKF